MLAFTVPKIYEVKKHEIDEGLAKAQGTTRQLYDQHLHKYVEKIPRAQNARGPPPAAKMDELKDALASELQSNKPVMT